MLHVLQRSACKGSSIWSIPPGNKAPTGAAFLTKCSTEWESESTTLAAKMAREGSPTPSEREKLDKEAKAKEEAEQAALPYKWTQTIQDLDISVTIPANLKGRDLDVKIERNKLRAGIKGQTPIVEVCICGNSITRQTTKLTISSTLGRAPPYSPR